MCTLDNIHPQVRNICIVAILEEFDEDMTFFTKLRELNVISLPRAHFSLNHN